MTKFYVERVIRRDGPAWEIRKTGEGRKCSCDDPEFAYRVVDLLNASRPSAQPSAAARAEA
jgi:hypothetical protein